MAPGVKDSMTRSLARAASLAAGCALALDVLVDDGQGRSAARRGEVGRGPEVLAFPYALAEVREVAADQPGGHTFEAVDQRGELNGGRIFDQQVGSSSPLPVARTQSKSLLTCRNVRHGPGRRARVVASGGGGGYANIEPCLLSPVAPCCC